MSQIHIQYSAKLRFTALFPAIASVLILWSCGEPETPQPLNADGATDGALIPSATLITSTGIKFRITLTRDQESMLGFAGNKINLRLTSQDAPISPNNKWATNLAGGLVELTMPSAPSIRIPFEAEVPAEMASKGLSLGFLAYGVDNKVWSSMPMKHAGLTKDGRVILKGWLNGPSIFSLFSMEALVEEVHVSLTNLTPGKVGFDILGTLPKGTCMLEGPGFSSTKALSSKNTKQHECIFSNVPAGKHRLKVMIGILPLWSQHIRVGGSIVPGNKTIEDLAKQHAPVLVFHGNESYSPRRLDSSYFKQMRVWVPFISPPKTSPTVEGEKAAAYLANHGHDLAFIESLNLLNSPWEATSPPTSSRSTIYWVAQNGTKQNDLLFLTYWMFYSNDEKISGHHRDRESVTVVLQKSLLSKICGSVPAREAPPSCDTGRSPLLRRSESRRLF